MNRTARIAAVIPAAGLLLLAGTASASTGAEKVYSEGSCHASGPAAGCNTDPSKPMKRPASAHIHVNASPSQLAYVNWDISCTAASGASADSDGSATLRAPFRRSIPLPVKHPVSCFVFAGTVLQENPDGTGGRGYVSLWVTYRR